ncbi:ABC transporter substrate-binding protein [Nocardioides sp. L-11A]|uniref:ABC transporter substrate-binding protein n=1 Tax=Nocardioides sp. L-11A TaxID=3043848 RepID=UPI00249B3B2E|nr:ABC transporter substrate-binding protein [Nocardioides sp. L-11A]
MKSWRTLAATAAAASLILTACGSEGSATNDDGDLLVMLSYKKSIYWLPLLVAEEKGFLADEGISLDLEETNGSGFVTQQLLSGNTAVGWAGAPDTVVAYSKNDEVRALMCNPPQNIFRIVVPEDSDITTVADLKGKTLGIAEAGGGEEPIVNASLADAGLERDRDVTVQPIGDAGPASLNAILDGQVDAYAGSYPDISTLSADGRLVTRDITPAEYNAIPGDCLITTAEHLEDEETRGQLVGLARAWAKGAIYAAAHPEEATELACAQVPQECEDMDFAAQYTKDTIALSGVTAEGDEPFGAVPVEAWETTIQVLEDSGAVSGDLDGARLGGGESVADFVADYSDFDVAELRAAP